MKLNKVKRAIIVTLGVCVLSFMSLQIGKLMDEDGKPAWVDNTPVVESTMNL